MPQVILPAKGRHIGKAEGTHDWKWTGSSSPQIRGGVVRQSRGSDIGFYPWKRLPQEAYCLLAKLEDRHTIRAMKHVQRL